MVQKVMEKFKISLILILKQTLISGQLFVSPSLSPSLPPSLSPSNHIENIAYLPLETRDTYGREQSSECALILQRTYINGKRSKSNSPLYGGFFDLFKRDG